ncbi:MAG: phenylalanine--tRNA ligase subunit alpha, partial [Nitrosarchaeum sp.]|nr:phenylalanine--tRNA ligase subunit alpha [Nitrosarchaeum sp.]
MKKKIITSLKDNPKQTPEQLEKSTNLSPDQIRRGIEWLKLKELAIVNESQTITLSLGINGLESFHKGLPERRLLDLLKNESKKLQDLQIELGSVFGPAIGLARKNNWVDASEDKISLKIYPSELPGEKTLKQIGENKIPKNGIDIDDLSSILKRPDFIVEDVIKTKEISLTENAKLIKITTGSSSAINVESKVPDVFVARTHPLKDTIDEIREIFVTLGFTEIIGSMTQPSFWNFDALFTPQDHPARSIHDIFFLKSPQHGTLSDKQIIENVKVTHENGWVTGSRGWG